MAGYTVLIGGTPVEWRAYRLPITPLTPGSGEYVSASTAAVATLGIRGIVKFFGIPDTSPTVIFCGNKAAIQRSDVGSSPKKVFHLARRIAFLQEQVNDKSILLYHITTEGQLAGIFTKPLGATVFHNLRKFFVKSRG